jgi:tetratricopeptide (TPR) repeat protein
VTADQDELHHGETIAPVETALRRSASAAPAVSAPRERRMLWPLAGMLLAGILWAVFFWLPARFTPVAPEPEAADAVPQVEAPGPAVPVLTPEQRAELQQQAEALLAQILTQQNQLAALRPEVWDPAAWTRYGDLARDGDDAFLDERYDLAVEAYERTLTAGRELLARSETLVAQALETAAQALAAADWELALSQYDLVLGIDATHDLALQGRERARKLPEVLTNVEQGLARERSGDLEGAVTAYRAALAIDAAWQPARDALERASANRVEQRFEALLSDGFEALSAQEYEAAMEFFEQALGMRPNAVTAAQGLAQAEQGLALDAIALAEARAAAFERRELWQQAIDQYQAALATDATLTFARDGLGRAQARADLDIKLANLLENPNLLFRDAILVDAEHLLEQAEAVQEPGPRLTKQAADLRRLVQLASTPLTITLRSDELTEVTLYRVGALGTFAEKAVELRPGTYTAVGSRAGYRDVRATFTVLPGQAIPAVTVRCVEPI